MDPRDEEWLLKAFADLRAQDRPELPAGLVARILNDAEKVQNAHRARRKPPVWHRWWQACKTRGMGLAAIPSAAAMAGFAAIAVMPLTQVHESDLINVAVLAVELEEVQTALGPDELFWIAGWPAGIIGADGETAF